MNGDDICIRMNLILLDFTLKNDDGKFQITYILSHTKKKKKYNAIHHVNQNNTKLSKGNRRELPGKQGETM